jgi:type IV pilus assembly protein PilO
MINLQQAQGQQGGDLGPGTLKRLWLWTPIAAAGALSALLLLALALPQSLELVRALNRLKVLEQERQELEVLKIETQRTQNDRKQAQRQGEQLIQLVTGKGDLATFLATLDLEAKQSAVTLELYEPVLPGVTPAGGGRPPGAAQPPPASPPPGGGDPSAPRAKQPAPDVLGKAGLKERSLVLVASGTYPQLLNFLRRMELLEVLVEQKDLTLTVQQSKNDPRPSELPLAIPTVEVRLALTLWSKEETNGRRREAGTPAPPAPAAPPAPPG